MHTINPLSIDPLDVMSEREIHNSKQHYPVHK
jgi:hypothetical protein